MPDARLGGVSVGDEGLPAGDDPPMRARSNK
jgi:hypothetical protein